MLDKIRTSIGFLYAKWYFRKTQEQQFVLTDFFRRSRNFLIVLPPGYEEAHIAGNSLKKLFDVLKNAHLTIVTTGIRATSLGEMQRSTVVRLDKLDITRFFLPSQSVLRNIRSRRYDVAIDMNLDFVLHAAYICRASHAPIRVGVKNERGELFFNVQLNLNRSMPLQHVYERFVHCLEMF